MNHENFTHEIKYTYGNSWTAKEIILCVICSLKQFVQSFTISVSFHAVFACVVVHLTLCDTSMASSVATIPTLLSTYVISDEILYIINIENL